MVKPLFFWTQVQKKVDLRVAHKENQVLNKPKQIKDTIAQAMSSNCDLPQQCQLLSRVWEAGYFSLRTPVTYSMG